MNSRLNKLISEFLFPLDISSHSTDIVEEALLKLANVSAKPNHSHFGSSAVEKNYIYVIHDGLKHEDIKSVFTCLKEKCQVEDVRIEGVNADELDDFPGFLLINADEFSEKVWPAIQDSIKQMLEESPEQIALYREQSMDDPDLIEYRVVKVLEKLIQDTQALELNCANDFVRGQLNILFQSLLDDIDVYEDHLAAHDNCGYGEGPVKHSIAHVNKFLTKNDAMAASTEGKALTDTLEKYNTVIKQRESDREEMGRQLRLLQNLSLFARDIRSASPEVELEQQEEEENRNQTGCRIQ